jgi:hypothetical protein
MLIGNHRDGFPDVRVRGRFTRDLDRPLTHQCSEAASVTAPRTELVTEMRVDEHGGWVRARRGVVLTSRSGDRGVRGCGSQPLASVAG